jgi:non-canonical purine NTP pyrophosphatase (RdgB/HAM1 family)
MFTISFVTSNPEKLKEFAEVQHRFSAIAITGQKYEEIPEILGSSYTDLIEKKALAAFTHFRRPVVVDHASLQIARLKNLPGAASKPFWDAVGIELHTILSRIEPTAEKQDVFAATVRVDVAYCDSFTLISKFDEVRGKIVPPSGEHFDWDKCFSPDGAEKGQSYAAMDLKTKYQFSARSKAFEKLLTELQIIGVPRR